MTTTDIDTDTEPDPVKVSIPTGDGAPFVSEGVWAVPVDLSAGLYRIDSVAFMTDGVSRGDLVRCDVSTDNRLVAVELVERSPNLTTCFGLAIDVDKDAYDARLRRLWERLRERYGDKVEMKVGFGVVAVCHPPELDEQLFATVLADCGRDGERNDEQHLLGDWQWFITTAPDWDQPEPIAGADQLLDVPVEVVAVDWAADDPVASTWDPQIVESLRSQAATNEKLRQMLDEKRYVAAVVPGLRMAMFQEFGPGAVGPQPFPLYPGEEDDDRFAEEWAAAKDDDGRVRWCVDDDVNREFRSVLINMGLDPDADPRAAVV